MVNHTFQRPECALCWGERVCHTSQSVAARGRRPRHQGSLRLRRRVSVELPILAGGRRAPSDFTPGRRGRPVKATPWAMATFPPMCFLLVYLEKPFASSCVVPRKPRARCVKTFAPRLARPRVSLRPRQASRATTGLQHQTFEDGIKKHSNLKKTTTHTLKYNSPESLER